MARTNAQRRATRALAAVGSIAVAALT
ncbi:MAG: hypothetical protein K0S70_4471, partial [Microbacterium sp.]|nr:hypothetical protein [Microbacterium sp.]